MQGAGWLNATVAPDGAGGLELVAEVAERDDALASAWKVVGSAYGWGPIPMLSIYDAGTELPVLPWNESIG